MTQMNFFNSNFFNVKPSDLEKGQNGGSNIALKKKAENEVFSDTEYDNIEKNFCPLKKIKDDKYLNDSQDEKSSSENLNIKIEDEKFTNAFKKQKNEERMHATDGLIRDVFRCYHPLSRQ